MTNRLPYVWMLGSALLPMACWAEDVITCRDDGTQAELNVCASDDFAAADAKLNRTFKAVMASLDPAAQTRLRAEQRRWLKQRDPGCRKEADDQAAGGSIWPMMFLGCKAALTESRTTALAHWKP